jgi:hypothetical protein
MEIMTNIGTRINDFDNSLGTVREFNKLFPDCPLNFNSELLVEILGIPLNKPFHRVLNIEGKLIEHDLFPTKKNKNEEKNTKRKPKKTFTYELYSKGHLIEKGYSLVSIAQRHLKQHDQHISKVLRQKGEYIYGDLRLIRFKTKKEGTLWK